MGGVIQGVGGLLSGNFQAQEAERQAKLTEIQANEVSAALASDLNKSLGNIEAAFASSGRDPNSPTAAGVRRRVTQTKESDIATERFNRLMRAAALRRGGQMAQTLGYIKLGAGIAGTAEDAIKARYGKR